MKRALPRILALLCIAAIGCHSISAGPEAACQGINEAISRGEAEVLGQYLADIVDLGISSASTRCSRAEAEQLMAEFFRQNKPCEFFCKPSRCRASGSLTTAGGKRYQVDYTLRAAGRQPVLTGLRVY